MCWYSFTKEVVIHFSFLGLYCLFFNEYREILPLG
jgi:hypothetical protein